jgi:dTDP-4-amino-4,6-dideoxygalactose transaminase
VTATVPFVDLGASVREIRHELNEAIARVLDSGWFVLGPECEALEAELADCFGVRCVVTTGNGTDSIQLALEALGVGPGDEVVTTPMSAAFTVLAIERAGARAVFADVEEDTLNLNPEAAERALTKRTRALLPVHLYGHPAEIESLGALARSAGIPLVEDACQAHGARYRDRKIGSFGAASALSFYPTKNLGALGDGGAMLTNDPRLADRVRRLRNGGQSDRYRHTEIGVNSRLDELQAAVLRVQLRHLTESTRRRRELAGLYEELLADVPVELPSERADVFAVRHLYVIRHPRRDALRERLERRGIGTLIHYPIPLHLQPAFAGLGGEQGQFPIAEQAAKEILSLPLYPQLGEDGVRTVAAAVREAVIEIG